MKDYMRGMKPWWDPWCLRHPFQARQGRLYSKRVHEALASFRSRRVAEGHTE